MVQAAQALEVGVCLSLSLSDSLQPHGLQSTRFLCPWDFLGKNIGVGYHFLLQENLPDAGIEPACRVLADALSLNRLGSPSKNSPK